MEPYSRHNRSVLQATRRESFEVVPFQQPADKNKHQRDGLRIIPIKPPGPANYSNLPAGMSAPADGVMDLDRGTWGRMFIVRRPVRRRRLSNSGLGGGRLREAKTGRRRSRARPKGNGGTGGNPQKGRVRLWGPARARPRRTGRPPGLACTGGGVHRTRRRRALFHIGHAARTVCPRRLYSFDKMRRECHNRG